MAYSRLNRARPFRASGVAYIPKIKKTELTQVHKPICKYIKKTYPHVIMHSDFGANLDMTEWQAKANKSLQSDDKFPDLTIFAPGRINPKTGQRYIGLALELKKDGTTVILKIGKDKGLLTKDEHIRAQARTLRKLNNQGWYANFAIGYGQAVKLVDWYFENENASLF